MTDEADMVVEMTEVTASVSKVGTALPPMTVEADVAAEITEGGIVVPGKVVVYVMYWPNAVTGMALPAPAAVYCVGSLRVAVPGGVAGVP